MIARKLVNNDFVIESGEFALVSDGIQAAQHTKARLQHFQNDWFLNLLSGTPWFQEIFIEPVNIRKVETILKSRIKHGEVRRIIAFQMELTGRRLNVTFEAETIYGDTFTEQIEVNK